ncbi:hypothetical protein GCM10020000_65050 [Streptomyces olivoverticillatus]
MSDSLPVPLAHRVPDLAALELLLAVARLGSLGRAARELGITQPAASGRVRSMERLLGVALVERSPRGSRLTDAGVLVTDWARRIVEAAEAFDAGAQALRSRRDSRLRVVASMTIAEYLMPTWLVALRAERPGTAVSLLAGNSAAVAERLRAGEADLGFVEGLQVPPGLDGVVVGRDRLMVVAAPGHPWARRRAPLEPGELAATPLVLRERGSGTRQVLDAALAAHGGAGGAAAGAGVDHGGEGRGGGWRRAVRPQRARRRRGAGGPPPGGDPGGGPGAPPRPSGGLARGPLPGGPGAGPAGPDVVAGRAARLTRFTTPGAASPAR